MQALKTPNVYRAEKDLSEVTVPAGTSVGATVFEARQGVANQRVLNTNDKQLVENFGIPIPDGNDVGIYAGMEFLKESDALWVVRATSGSEKYACLILSAGTVVSAGTAGIQARSTTALLAAAPDGNTDLINYDIDNPQGSVVASSALLVIASKGPGSYGNNVGITLFTSAISASTSLSGNYDWGNKYDYPAKVFKISVFVKADTDSSFPLVAEETFYVTTEYLKDGEGKQLFVEDVINGKSAYIYVANQGNGNAGASLPSPVYGWNGGVAVALVGGADAALSTSTNPYNATQAQIDKAWDLFLDRTKVSVNILMDSLKTPVSTPNAGVVACSRLDCMACVQVGSSTAVTVASILAATFPTISIQSYASVYAGWDKLYDSFNDRYVMIPKCIYGAVLMARTDRVANVWDAPAGMNRGILPSLGQNIVFSDTDIGNLYDVNINTSRFIRGVGHVMWGQKTAQKKKSALDRINVRRLLLYIENSVEPSLLPFLFEPNNAKTRLRAWSAVDGFMNTVLAGGGVTKYEVVCDETNNTAQIIDTNTMVLDVYVQPTKTIEYIRLNVIVTRTGVNFTEIR